jgi:hypothetical protein
MHKVEQNCTKKRPKKQKTKKPTKCPKFKCNTVSVSFPACRCSLVVFSSKVGREKKKKKESGDSSVNGICGCGLPAHCCQPAVAGGIIYADLRGELSTHLAPTSFPLSKHTRGSDTAPAFSGLCVCYS